MKTVKSKHKKKKTRVVYSGKCPLCGLTMTYSHDQGNREVYACVACGFLKDYTVR